jgi:hypothetical protein
MSTFLHFDLLHIACNMWGLLLLGPIVEQVFGHARFVIIYLGAGLAGSLSWQIFSQGLGISAGASGSVFGLITATAVFGYRHGGILGRVLMRRMLLWSALMFAFGFAVPSINNWAHGGGAAAGALLAAVLGLRERSVRGEGPRIRLAAAVSLLACAIAFVLTIVGAVSGPSMQEARTKSVFLWHEDDVYSETEQMLAWAERTLPIVVARHGAVGSEQDRGNLLDSLGDVAQVLDYWGLAGRRADPEVDPAVLAEGLRHLHRAVRDGNAAGAAALAAKLLPDIQRMRRALRDRDDGGERPR